MPDSQIDDLDTAARQWQKGKNQGEQCRELWIMLVHTIGTLQTVMDHFGLTEVLPFLQSPEQQNSANGAGQSGS